MQTPDSLNDVAEFHRTFNHPILESPQLPDPKRRQFRINLLAEELKELEEAVNQEDLTEVADALCDLQYVLAGAILEFGLGEKFKALFDEVQRSNLSKACTSEEEAKATVSHYVAKGQPCHYQLKDGKYLVYRDEDHKTLKSINYSPADIKSIVS